MLISTAEMRRKAVVSAFADVSIEEATFRDLCWTRAAFMASISGRQSLEGALFGSDSEGRGSR